MVVGSVRWKTYGKTQPSSPTNSSAMADIETESPVTVEESTVEQPQSQEPPGSSGAAPSSTLGGMLQAAEIAQAVGHGIPDSNSGGSAAGDEEVTWKRFEEKMMFQHNKFTENMRHEKRTQTRRLRRCRKRSMNLKKEIERQKKSHSVGRRNQEGHEGRHRKISVR